MSYKILIIDDEPALLTALVDEFTREGFETIKAKNGLNGLRLAFKTRPDLILLDIVMPVMDGITMLYKLREDNWGKKVKVILLTNLSDSGKVTKSIIKMISGHLVKSDWKIKDIVKQVRKKICQEY